MHVARTYVSQQITSYVGSCPLFTSMLQNTTHLRFRIRIQIQARSGDWHIIEGDPLHIKVGEKRYKTSARQPKSK